MDIEIWGTEWCNTCTVTRKHLTALDLPFTFHKLPPGPRGFQIVEELTGKPAVPAISVDGDFLPFKKFKYIIDSLGLTPRKLTEEELDEFR